MKRSRWTGAIPLKIPINTYLMLPTPEDTRVFRPFPAFCSHSPSPSFPAFLRVYATLGIPSPLPLFFYSNFPYLFSLSVSLRPHPICYKLKTKTASIPPFNLALRFSFSMFKNHTLARVQNPMQPDEHASSTYCVQSGFRLEAGIAATDAGRQAGW